MRLVRPKLIVALPVLAIEGEVAPGAKAITHMFEGQEWGRASCTC